MMSAIAICYALRCFQYLFTGWTWGDSFVYDIFVQRTEDICCHCTNGRHLSSAPIPSICVTSSILSSCEDFWLKLRHDTSFSQGIMPKEVAFAERWHKLPSLNAFFMTLRALRVRSPMEVVVVVEVHLYFNAMVLAKTVTSLPLRVAEEVAEGTLLATKV